MPVSVLLIKKLEEVEPQLRGVLITILEEIERQREETVAKKEFNELKDIVRELAEAQKKTEQELRKLVKEHSKTREQLGGLSNTVGYILENEAFKALPALLKEEFGLEIKGRPLRKFVRDNHGQQIEVNIVGEASKDGERFIIIGESKSQLSKNKILEFLRKKVKRLEGVFEGQLFPVLVTHMITAPDVEDYALQKGIKRVYYSYEF